MAYLGFYPQHVSVRTSTGTEVANFYLADAKSFQKLNAWWAGAQVRTDDMFKNGALVSPSVEIPPWKTDKDRRDKLVALGCNLPENVDIPSLKLVSTQGRIWTFDALSLENVEATSPAKLLYAEISTLTGEQVKARMANFSPAERKKFLSLMAGL